MYLLVKIALHKYFEAVAGSFEDIDIAGDIQLDYFSHMTWCIYQLKLFCINSLKL